MDQRVPCARDPAGVVHPEDAAPPADAALPAGIAHPADARDPAVAARPVDAGYPADARDPEALRPPAPPARSRRALWGVLAVFLLLSVLGVAAGVSHLWLVPASPKNVSFASRSDAEQPEVFGRLLTRNVTLSEGTLSWYSQRGFGSVHLSRDLSYDDHSEELVVARGGLYCVFLQPKLKCALLQTDVVNEWGRLSLSLEMQPPYEGQADLALTMDLPPCSGGTDSPREAKDSWRRPLSLKSGQRLSVRLQGVKNPQEAWQLAQSNATAFGLFNMNSKTPPDACL